MKILLIRPSRQPVVTEIDHNLKSEQSIVGGYIETIRLDRNTIIVCNEEGKIQNLPPNRFLFDANGSAVDLICGDFFICGLSRSGDDFCSLSDKQIKKYSAIFSVLEINHLE